jgi:hypothetical protein
MTEIPLVSAKKMHPLGCILSPIDVAYSTEYPDTRPSFNSKLILPGT